MDNEGRQDLVLNFLHNLLIPGNCDKVKEDDKFQELLTEEYEGKSLKNWVKELSEIGDYNQQYVDLLSKIRDFLI